MVENIVYCMGEKSKWKSMDKKSMGEKVWAKTF